jgi:hypothetical protein
MRNGFFNFFFFFLLSQFIFSIQIFQIVKKKSSQDVTKSQSQLTQMTKHIILTKYIQLEGVIKNVDGFCLSLNIFTYLDIFINSLTVSCML